MRRPLLPLLLALLASVLLGVPAVSGAADARFRVALDGRIGGAVQGTPEDLTARFGAPSARRTGRGGTTCELRWSRIGLRATYAVLGEGELSACEDGQFVGARLTGSRWHTTRGLRVGTPERRIRATGARRCAPGQCFSSTAGTHVRNGWVLSSHHNRCTGRRSPTVVARTTRGRISSFQVDWIGCE